MVSKICQQSQIKLEDIAHAVRAHWGVENGLHWRLDVSFHEDGWRAREGNSVENMSLINKMALNLLKKEPTAKLGVKKKASYGRLG